MRVSIVLALSAALGLALSSVTASATLKQSVYVKDIGNGTGDVGDRQRCVASCQQANEQLAGGGCLVTDDKGRRDIMLFNAGQLANGRSWACSWITLVNAGEAPRYQCRANCLRQAP
jgi:hypothetical protein